MIPVRLSLTNFMPYHSEVSVDFSAIHVASICGDNGSGKSSIVDAITWALWGKARARSDDDLIYQGETGMQVIFDFAAGDQTYRVIRKRTRARSQRGAGQSVLELQVLGAGGPRPVTGDSISQTERKIVEILHMDYETFINSAFLRQGHADEFTVARPQERKAVLASILNLGDYDRLESQAREIAAERERARLGIESSLAEISRELSQEAAYEQELDNARQQLAEIEKQAEERERLLADLRSQKEDLTRKQAQAKQLDEEIVRASGDLERWVAQGSQHRSRASEYEKLLERRQTIEEGFARLQAVRKLNDELMQTLRLVSSIQEKQHKLELAIMQANRQLDKEYAITERALADLRSRSNKAPLAKEELTKVQNELARLATSEAALGGAKAAAQQLVSQIKSVEAEKARLDREVADISEKLKLLASGRTTTCPLCERELSAEHLVLITNKFTQERLDKAAQARTLAAEAARLRENLVQNEAAVTREELKLTNARAELQGKVGALTKSLAEAEEARKSLEEQQSRLRQLEERIALKNYARAEQEALAHLTAELQSLNYDHAKHEQTRQELEVLTREYEEPKRRLEQAERLLEAERSAAVAAESAAAELRSSIEQRRALRAALASGLEALPSIMQALAAAEEEYRAVSSRQKEAQRDLGRATEKLDRCRQLRELKARREEEHRMLSVEESVYRDLAEAFGKRGVQALLIETALPEIENEANRLLARMTDNRMHVKFETQRAKKDGGTIETLDINIADELGTRSYEMFSGGEAFRINFAIRVALSKVLARRAGAPLPTLIIDEGFGTQDSNGIEKLKEAIASVQDDFERILVITHVEDFRDAFPVRIEVTKRPDGSTVQVI